MDSKRAGSVAGMFLPLGVRGASLGLIVAVASAPSASAATSYTVTDIGLPDDSSDPSSVQAMGLNDLGEVTGSYTNADGHQHAFLYTHGVVQDLGTLGGSYSVGIAVNDSSEVTGSSRPSDASGDEHAFLHNGVFMDDLGTLGGAISQGRGINASGEITGEADVSATARHAFWFDGLTLHDLGVTGGAGSSGGFDLTDTGLITGGSITEGGARHAFFYDGLAMHDLGTLGGFVSEGRGINATGQIAGFAFTAGFVQHAFFWDGAIMHDLGTLGGAKSFGNGIDDAGIVVGTSDVDETALTHAFVWDGAMHDLNDLLVDLPPGVTIELQSVQYGGSINASGQIAATGRYLTGGPGPLAMRAFLLTPVPEPTPAASLAIASVALAAIARVRRRGVRALDPAA